MSRILAPILIAFAIVAGESRADVLNASTAGFTVQTVVEIQADRATVWSAAIDDIGQWWSDDHTIAGDASRLSIDARPMGCFCEQLEGDDGVVHLLVTSVSRNVMLRMTGGLGPLGLMGVNGNMTWEFMDVEEGTQVRLTYAVGGYSVDGLDSIADAVDGVLATAMMALKLYVESR